jgi:hypothetical protein
VSAPTTALPLSRGRQGQYDRALESFYKTLGINLSTLGDKHPDTATDYNGTMHPKMGNYSGVSMC